MKNIIRKILKEEYQDTIELSAELFKSLLLLVNYDTDNLIKLKMFKKHNNLPKFIINGNLDLSDTPIKSLPKLKEVRGNLYLDNRPIKFLDDLEYVGGHLNLDCTQIQSLPKLKEVRGYLSLQFTPLSKTITKKELIKKIKTWGEIYF